MVRKTDARQEWLQLGGAHDHRFIVTDLFSDQGLRDDQMALIVNENHQLQPGAEERDLRMRTE
jgi:hypothetical protein